MSKITWKTARKRSSLLILVIITLSSCQTQRISFRRNLDVDYVNFNYLIGKAKLKYNDGKQNVSFAANFRIKKDSLLWMSASKLGIEGARMLVTQDSVFILDRLHKRFLSQSLSDLSEKFDFQIDYNLIESVVLGNLIHPYSKEKLDKSEDGYLKYDQQQESFIFNNYIGRKTKKLEKLRVEDTNTNTVISVNYGNFKEVDEEIFPFSIGAVIDYAESKKDVDISIGFNRAEIADKPLTFPFSAPSKYKRL